jgi:hypothetical protein
VSGQYQIQQLLLWVIHLERVTTLVLVALGASALAIRLAVLRLRARGRPHPGPAWLTSVGGALLIAVSLGAGASATLLSVRPDTFFLIQMGRDAVARRDTAGIITYYEPLARWQTDRVDVYENLALAYFDQRHPRAGIAALHAALALSPSLQDNLVCGAVHLALGEVAQVRVHVEAARLLVSTPEQQAAVERLAAAASPPSVNGR